MSGAPLYPVEIWILILAELDYFTLRRSIPKVCRLFSYLTHRSSPNSSSPIDKALFRDSPRPYHANSDVSSDPPPAILGGAHVLRFHPLLPAVVCKHNAWDVDARVVKFRIDRRGNVAPTGPKTVHPYFSRYVRGTRLWKIHKDNIVSPATSCIQVCFETSIGWWPCPMCRYPAKGGPPEFEISSERAQVLGGDDRGSITLWMFLKQVTMHLRQWYGWGHYCFTVRATLAGDPAKCKGGHPASEDRLLYKSLPDVNEGVQPVSVVVTLISCSRTLITDWWGETGNFFVSFIPEDAPNRDRIAKIRALGFVPSEAETKHQTLRLAQMRADPE